MWHFTKRNKASYVFSVSKEKKEVTKSMHNNAVSSMKLYKKKILYLWIMKLLKYPIVIGYS